MDLNYNQQWIKLKERLRPVYRATLKPLREAAYAARYAPANRRLLNSTAAVLEGYRDKHRGERCFIIGNGPSLTPEDLSMLKEEVCFGVNQIYDIFAKTDWRPSYYCVSDLKLLSRIKDDIENKISCQMFTCIDLNRKGTAVNSSCYVRMKGIGNTTGLLPFSADASDCIYSPMTVTYMCLQLAVYMGFSEIYLLGVDHNYAVSVDESGNIVRQDVPDHFSSGYTTLFPFNQGKATLAYESAKAYCDGHGVKVFNATRGGKLEVFERVDLDSLFQ